MDTTDGNTDKRELPRTRIEFAAQRTKLKNRIHSALDKYGFQSEIEDMSDIFSRKGRPRIHKCMEKLLNNTKCTLGILLNQLETTEQQVDMSEKRMKEEFAVNEDIELLMTLPGVGFILAVVITLRWGRE